MPFVYIIFIYLALEIYVLIQVWGAYGFVHVFFALLLGFVVGSGVVRTQSRALAKLQTSMQSGNLSTQANLHPDKVMGVVLGGVLKVLAGVLFIVPGFVSDILGMLFLLPGSRHLIVVMAKHLFRNKMTKFASGFSQGFDSGPFKNSRFQVFTFGNMGRGMGGPSAEFRSGSKFGAEFESGFDRSRDVTPKIIDVTPISDTAEKKEH